MPCAEAWRLLETLGPEGLDRLRDAAWLAEARAFDPEAEERRAADLGARLLVRGEPGYPALLAALPDPPLVLYLQGELSERPAVAFVGSRTPTPYGRRMARRLAGDAARRGGAVVSGLARGVDAEAHQAALDAGGVSWGVLGTGLGHVYPRENAELARRLVERGGAVLSEMPLGTAPRPELFPRRNRIVAGLAWATVVVEGRRKSGSLITARLAAGYGREVLAVPGPADSPLSEAPHLLIAQGASLAATVDDLWRVLPPGEGGALPSDGGVADLTKEEAGIVALLGADSLSLDELVRLTGLDTARISSIMFELEIKEAIISVPGQRYAQKAR